MRIDSCESCCESRVPLNSLPYQSTEKDPKPKLLSPDIFRLGWGLPRQRVGAKKFGMSLETREIKLFCRDIPGFCRDIPAVPGKFEKKKLCAQFLAPSCQQTLIRDAPPFFRIRVIFPRKKGIFGSELWFVYKPLNRYDPSSFPSNKWWSGGSRRW